MGLSTGNYNILKTGSLLIRTIEHTLNQLGSLRQLRQLALMEILLDVLLAVFVGLIITIPILYIVYTRNKDNANGHN